MTRKPIKSFFVVIMTIILCLATPNNASISAMTCNSLDYIILSSYYERLNIGQEFILDAFSTNGKIPTYKSSKSSIASVTSYGLVTAKKAGSCRITVKAGNAEAYCDIKVIATTVTLSTSSATLENGATLQLTVESSTGHTPKWKSSKSSVASVDDNGLVTAKKVGEATITVTVDGTSAACKIKVKAPTLKLSHREIKLYRTNQQRLKATVSSGKKPTFKSNKSSVATVSDSGLITAIKHGTATITVSVDGVSKTCTVTVEVPTIKLSQTKAELKVGQSLALTAEVSSGNKPTWSSSNINVATVDENGNVTARQKGKAYIYAKEDGAKVSCIVTVTE